MFEMVKAIHEALHIESTWAFVVVIAAAFALMSGSVAWVVDQGYKNSVREGSHPNLSARLQVVWRFRMPPNTQRIRGPQKFGRRSHESAKSLISAFPSQIVKDYMISFKTQSATVYSLQKAQRDTPTMPTTLKRRFTFGMSLVVSMLYLRAYG